MEDEHPGTSNPLLEHIRLYLRMAEMVAKASNAGKGKDDHMNGYMQELSALGKVMIRRLVIVSAQPIPEQVAGVFGKVSHLESLARFWANFWAIRANAAYHAGKQDLALTCLDRANEWCKSKKAVELTEKKAVKLIEKKQ